MNIIEVNVGKMEAQLKKWRIKLDELGAQADQAGTEARVDYRKRLDDMKTKHQAAQAKLEELRAAGNEKWETFRIGVESSWRELEAAFKGLAS